MKNLTKYIFRFSTLLAILTLCWGVQRTLGGSSGPQKEGRFLNPPDSTNSNDTTLRFPLDKETNPYEKPKTGGLYLKDPSNIKEDITFDPDSKEYTITRKIGDMDYRRPASMSFDEYKDWDLKKSVNKYWKEKSKSSSGPGRQGIIPQIRLGGELFDRVFGGNTIDIRPQGSAELSFGVVSNKREDPAIDKRLRRTTNFDFQEKIQMSVLAKIGDKIEFNTNFNTEATFDFENKLKLKYEGKEDEIIKLIEAGNVNMPLNSTLITGSQSLFGIKTQLQFGKATVTSVFSQQQSQVQNIAVQGGAQTTKFSLRSLEYEENKHFFLSQYFYKHYDEALASLPIVTSNISIEKIEVWITNIGTQITENRNIVAFQDLGEREPYNSQIIPNIGYYPDNKSNNLLSQLDTSQVRNNGAESYLTANKGFIPGTDFATITNARKLNTSEYTYNNKLGFISLNTTLSSDQTLAVAFQYRVIGGDSTTYQVGEFSNEVRTTGALMVKLLRSTAVNTHIPTWNLMMKNVYNIQAYNVNRDDFILNILYSGNSNAVPTGYFTDGTEGDGINGVPLLQIFGFDRMDQQQNPPHDGFFDFIDQAARNGGTIQASNGRIFFPSVAPFGSYLRNKLNNKALADKYCYDSLYTMTRSGAEQFPSKNKFVLEGQYKSESGSEISLNATNIPQGSVKVTAGGVPLIENSQYTVDYTLGRVKILDEGILNSGTPINISLENNSMFNVYSQTLLGTHVDYKVSKDLLLGGTIMNLYERPITQKTNYGDEPISNTIWGMSINYQKESNFITKMVDKLPFISTKVPSKLKFDGEFAQFLPGHSKAVGKTGTSYIDDFEGAKSTISLTTISSWFMASTPQYQTSLSMFPESAPGTGLVYGFNRAKLAWYNIDASVFYDRGSNKRPGNIDRPELSRNSTRVVYQNELFPNAQTANNQPMNIPMFNLAYFPDERGPYNFDVGGTAFSKGMDSKGHLKDPASRWGGIMSKIQTTDFEAANVEYLTFWLMDPFTEDSLLQGGDLYFNLGDISEDILRDNRKSYENGLPVSAEVVGVDSTIWGRVPIKENITESFSSDPAARPYQDIGYDGLSDKDERVWDYNNFNFLQQIRDKFGVNSEAYVLDSIDPAADDYHHFEGADYDNDSVYSSVTARYKNYNGVEGNSPAGNTEALATRNPNVEDINRDNTLSGQERYFQYVVHLRPDQMVVGQNYISDMYEAKPEKITLENGGKIDVKWYQFKIPLRQPDKVVGTIQDFKSIRFIRLFLKNFERPIVCRFASLELERGEWRKYYNSLLAPGEYIPDPNQDATTFDISTVSYEENGSRTPINYVIPPGINREVNVATTNYQQLNEQSMVLKTCDLMDGDARGAFKTTDFDFRDYKHMKMYIHAEKSIKSQELKTGDLTVFVRMGSDFTENYYEYEIPLTFTEWDHNDKDEIWPAANDMDIELAKFITTKEIRNNALNRVGSNMSITTPFTIPDGKNKITIVGSPSLSDVRAFMIGVRNPRRNPNLNNGDDGLAKCAEIWVNELRLTDFNEKSGWAATARVATNLADLGTVVLSGSYSTPGFGSIEKKVNERQKETIRQIDFATNLELGKFLPEKSGIRIPMHYDYSQTVSNPQYNPLDPDVDYTDQVKSMSKHEKDSLKSKTLDVTQRQNLNFMNVRKDRLGSKGKPHIWDIENFDLSYAYSEISKHNIDIESDKKKTYKGGLGYNFSINPKNVKPFQKLIKSKSLQIISDINFYYLPRLMSFRTDMDREYERRLVRNKSNAAVIIDPSYTKKWDWTRIYDLKYDISQSLKFDYSANVNAYIHEPSGGFEKSNSNYQAYKDTVMSSLLGLGSMSRFNQLANINYMVPLNKIPILSFMTASVKYGVNYRWEASPRSMQARVGNTIENSNNYQLNGGIRMSTIYNKVGFLKRAAAAIQAQGQSKPAPDMPGKGKGKEDDGKQKNPKKELVKNGKEKEAAADSTDAKKKPRTDYLKLIGNQLLGVLMSFKDANITYNETNGILLPGFMPEPGVLGNNWKQNAPGLGFIMGSQRDITKIADPWLTKDSVTSSYHVVRHTSSLTFRANLEPFRNLKIEVNADRNFTTSQQDYYKYDASQGVFRPSVQTDVGTFSMSYLIWPTAFKKDNKDNVSTVFEKMLEYRQTFAARLAARNPNSVGDTLGFPHGYGPSQPEVLLNSFMAAYAGRDPSKFKMATFPKIPLPNWRITYNANQGIKFLKNYFQSFNINHGYRSSYTVGGFQSDSKAGGTETAPSEINANTGNFIPLTSLGVVTISEQFSPLIGIDATMKNSMLVKIELKKSRNLSLSFVSNQLMEMRSKEIVTGVGYRFKNVKFTVRSMTTGKKTPLKSDLNVKLDFSIRDNKTIVRRIEENDNTISTGNKQVSVNFSADYMVSPKLNIRLYYETTASKPYTNQIPTSTTNAGVSLRFTLAQ
ncbi:MAG: cell surface protein SprA [Bacteroidetes bacterium]|nr:cell surface protein SprA [Bacteroidota bacterium]